jgi:hypothetical protein
VAGIKYKGFTETKLMERFLYEFETRFIFFLGKEFRKRLAMDLDITQYYFNRTLHSLVKKGILEMVSYKHYKLNPVWFPNKKVILYNGDHIIFEIEKSL